MSFSLILTNCLFCALAALLLLPLLRQPYIITYKNGIPIFVTVILVFIKQLMPYEFSFTYTLASKNILPILKTISNYYLLENVTIGNIFLYTWFLISMLFLIHIAFKHRKLMRILSIVPATQNIAITQLLSELYIKMQIQNKPKVIQLDINTGPFIAGLRNPIIVLPLGLCNREVRFILLHELEHFKNRHILIKTCTEIVTAIYWWNPIVWLLRKEVIRALEIQADLHVVQKLTNKVKLNYLESLIKISKNIYKNQSTNFALSFTLNRNMLEYRINTALKFKSSSKYKKLSIFHVCPVILSVVILLTSTIYTFESYNVNPIKVNGTFTINNKTDYFILREDNLYDLYVNDKCIVTIPTIPEDLSNLPIHK